MRVQMYNPQLDVDVGVLPEMLQTQFIRSGEKSQAASTVAPSITYKIDDVRNDHSTKGWRLSAADTSINQSIHFAIEIDLIDDGDDLRYHESKDHILSLECSTKIDFYQFHWTFTCFPLESVRHPRISLSLSLCNQHH